MRKNAKKLIKAKRRYRIYHKRTPVVSYKVEGLSDESPTVINTGVMKNSNLTIGQLFRRHPELLSSKSLIVHTA